LKKKIAMSFSGKDSVLALHKLLREKPYVDEYEVITLMSTANEEYSRVSIHGVRKELLQAQADSIGLPLKIVWLPKDCPSEKYQEIMKKACEELLEQDIQHVAFGDIFLADVKRYREDMLATVGMKAIFPLWDMDTAHVIDEFLTLDYKTIITCVDLTRLPEDFSGKEITRQLLAALPLDVDICGENGEYHSFVFDGPIYKQPIPFTVGEKHLARDTYTGTTRFCFTDIKPAETLRYAACHSEPFHY